MFYRPLGSAQIHDPWARKGVGCESSILGSTGVHSMPRARDGEDWGKHLLSGIMVW